MTGGISLWFGHGTRNVGDVALNTGAAALLESSGAQLDVALLPPLRGANLEAAQDSLPGAVRTTMLSADAMSIDSLLEYVEHPERLFRNYGVDGLETVLLHAGEHLYAPADLATVHPLALWRMLPGLAAAATGRRLIILPSTFGPFQHRGYAAVVGALIRSADAIAARDGISAAAAEALRRRPIAALLDPAFFVRPVSTPAAGAGRAAISMRLEGYGLRAGSQQSERVLAEHEAAGFRTSTSFRSTLTLVELLRADERVSSVTLIAQTSSDLPLMQAAQAALASSSNPLPVDFVDAHRLTPHEAQDLLAAHDLLVTSRFHGSVLAIAAGTPAGGLPLTGHGHKIPGLYDVLGEPGWTLPVDRVDNAAALSGLLDRLREPDRADRVAARLDHARGATSAWLAAALHAPITDSRRRGQRALRAVARLAQARQAALERG
mgnify:CR=1 FL=1